MNSFSASVKKELSKLNNLANKNLVKSELKGYLLTFFSNEFSTESEYNINRFAKLLNNLNINDYSISIKGNKYIIKFDNVSINKLLEDTKEKKDSDEEYSLEIDEQKAIIRGAFLGAGTITEPKKTYHLEIVFENEENANYVKKLLNMNSIISNIIKRENKYLVYIDDGENISNFLAFSGANKSVLEFEDIRAYKEMRNKVNRLVNYETANMNKTIISSVKQIDDIKFIKTKKQFEKLSHKEQELARLRISKPNASLKELGELLTPPISKSGVKHRMENISKFADELRNNT